MNAECREIIQRGGKPDTLKRKVKVVELPLGATEDRVVGTIDLEHALRKGEKRIETGILAEAHRGFLYVDEVNLLDDHIVDILLDSAAMGVCTVEREGVSFSHPSRFVFVGTMNPEEGELRPQLLDRFGLCVHIEGLRDNEQRAEILKRITDFEEAPAQFAELWKDESDRLRDAVAASKKNLPKVQVDRDTLLNITGYCLETGVDGHRGDIIALKCAKTIAAYRGGTIVETRDIEEAFELSLPHRVRRQPFHDIGSDPSGFSGFKGFVQGHGEG
jgi:magnesium chelatase subunit I